MNLITERDTQHANVRTQLKSTVSLDKSSKPSGCHKLHNHGHAVAFPKLLQPWTRPVSRCSVDGQRTASPETTYQVGYVAIAPVGNNSYASQTHKTGRSYECYI